MLIEDALLDGGQLSLILERTSVVFVVVLVRLYRSGLERKLGLLGLRFFSDVFLDSEEISLNLLRCGLKGALGLLFVVLLVLLVEPVELLLLELPGKVLLRHCSERLLMTLVWEQGVLSHLGEWILSGGELTEGRLGVVLVKRVGEDVSSGDVDVVVAADQVDDVGSAKVLLEKCRLDGLAHQRLVSLEGLEFEALIVAGLMVEVVVGVDVEILFVESRLEDDFGLGSVVLLDKREAEVVVVVVFLFFGAVVADNVLDVTRELGVDLGKESFSIIRNARKQSYHHTAKLTKAHMCI